MPEYAAKAPASTAKKVRASSETAKASGVAVVTKSAAKSDRGVPTSNVVRGGMLSMRNVALIVATLPA